MLHRANHHYLSYAKTLDSWYNNIGDWPKLTDFSDSFRRLWAYYLLGCAAFFELRIIGLWQIIYTKLPSNRPDDCHHIRM
ncbi:MAG: class I SAM-dependent methyltransferase [Candidatus Comchoanobacterales bacterium]